MPSAKGPQPWPLGWLPGPVHTGLTLAWALSRQRHNLGAARAAAASTQARRGRCQVRYPGPALPPTRRMMPGHWRQPQRGSRKRRVGPVARAPQAQFCQRRARGRSAQRASRLFQLQPPSEDNRSARILTAETRSLSGLSASPGILPLFARQHSSNAPRSGQARPG